MVGERVHRLRIVIDLNQDIQPFRRVEGLPDLLGVRLGDVDLDAVDWLFPDHEQYCVSLDLVTTIRRYLEDRLLASLGPVE